MSRSGSLFARLYRSFALVLLAGNALIILLVGLSIGPGLLPTRPMEQTLALLAREMSPLLSHPAELQAALLAEARDLDLDLAVLDAQGHLLAAAGHMLPQPRGAHLPDANAKAAILFGWPLATILPIRGPGGVTGHIEMGVSRFLSFNRAPVRPLVGLAFALAMSVALISRLARSITQPITRLSTAVERFGAGELDVRTGLKTGDEIGRLGQAFDRMANRIKSARDAEKRLMASVSHELRTPLSRLRVTLALIDPSSEAVARRVEDADRELEELDRLVEDLLLTHRAELSPETLDRAPVPLGPMLERAAVRVRVLDSGLEVIILAADALWLDADASVVTRAIDNVLDNARKYGAGPIRIEARRVKSRVRIEVSDSGPGIPVSERDRVFDPFFRGASAPGRATGFGLGLALVRRVVEAHGGTVEITDAAPHGTVLAFTLPAVDPP